MRQTKPKGGASCNCIMLRTVVGVSSCANTRRVNGAARCRLSAVSDMSAVRSASTGLRPHRQEASLPSNVATTTVSRAMPPPSLHDDLIRTLSARRQLLRRVIAANEAGARSLERLAASVVCLVRYPIRALPDDVHTRELSVLRWLKAQRLQQPEWNTNNSKQEDGGRSAPSKKPQRRRRVVLLNHIDRLIARRIAARNAAVRDAMQSFVEDYGREAGGNVTGAADVVRRYAAALGLDASLHFRSRHDDNGPKARGEAGDLRGSARSATVRKSEDKKWPNFSVRDLLEHFSALSIPSSVLLVPPGAYEKASSESPSSKKSHRRRHHDDDACDDGGGDPLSPSHDRHYYDRQAVHDRVAFHYFLLGETTADMRNVLLFAPPQRPQHDDDHDNNRLIHRTSSRAASVPRKGGHSRPNDMMTFRVFDELQRKLEWKQRREQQRRRDRNKKLTAATFAFPRRPGAPNPLVAWSREQSRGGLLLPGGEFFAWEEWDDLPSVQGRMPAVGSRTTRTTGGDDGGLDGSAVGLRQRLLNGGDEAGSRRHRRSARRAVVRDWFRMQETLALAGSEAARGASRRQLRARLRSVMGQMRQ